MNETPFPSGELVVAAERMFHRNARRKLVVALEFGMKKPSFSTPELFSQHWNRTQETVGEAARQIFQEGLPEERLGEMLKDIDDRISTLFLSGITMRLPFGYLTSEAGNLIVDAIPAHPSRRFREAGIVFLESTGMLRPTPAVVDMREAQMRRDDLSEEEFRRRRIQRPIKWACAEEAVASDESPLFPGQMQRWQIENAFPIMALLWHTGHADLQDLACIDPNQTALQADLNTLTELGEVETKSVRGEHGGKRTVFTLIRPGFWQGPPW